MSMLNTGDVKQALEKKKQRHYAGVCEDNADPLKLGRLKIRVKELWGEIPTAHLPWCNPTMPFGGEDHGFFFIPAVGSNVRILLWRNHPWFPIWQGVHWFEGQTPAESQLTPPTNYVIKTPAKHLMDFNDTPSSSYMRLKDLRGNYFIIHSSEDTIKMKAVNFRSQFTGDMNETVQGFRRSSVTGAYDINVDGIMNIRAGVLNIDAALINLNSGAANPQQALLPTDVEIQ